MKKKIRLLSMLLSLSLAFNYTGLETVDVKDNPYYSENYESSEENDNREEEILQEEMVSDLSNERRSSLVDQYLDYFNNITYVYYGNEYYLNDEEIKELIRKADTIKNCTNEMVTTDVIEVMENIKNNSSQYIASHDFVSSAFMEIDNPNSMNNSILQSTFECALKEILKNLLEEAKNDIKEDFCRLNDLSICNGKVSDIVGIEGNNLRLILGYYNSEDNVIVLDFDAIYDKYENLTWYYEDTGMNISLISIFSISLSHEFNHVRQTACNCRINAGQEYLDIDYSDSVSVLIEASAESDLYNSRNFIFSNIYNYNKNYAYKEERRCEALIQLMGLMNNSSEDYYNAIFDSNINALFEFLGANTDEEKVSIYRILYAIDGINYRNDLISRFNEEEYKDFIEPTDVIGREYCYEIMNKFTIDLIQYINNHDDFTLLEAMCLFNFAQSICLEDMQYLMRQDENFLEFVSDEDVVNKINDTRIKFYEFLKQYYEVDDKELLKVIRQADSTMFIADSSVDSPDYNIPDMEKYQDFLRLVEKFPLLKSIMFATEANYFTYERIYKSNGLSLVLD